MASTLSRFRRWAKTLVRAGAEHRTTAITMQTDRIVIIRHGHATSAWCQECSRAVGLVSLEDAAAITGTAASTLLQSSQSQQWHYYEDRDGALLICLESLLKSNLMGILRNSEVSHKKRRFL